VLRIREGHDHEPTRLDLATALVVRASTGPPAAAEAAPEASPARTVSQEQ
jgi:hypothetical protein